MILFIAFFALAGLGLLLWARGVTVGRTLLLGLILSYAIAFGELCYDPYFEDNGLPAFIPWSERWGWAVFLGGFLAIAIVPATFAATFIYRKIARQT